MRELSIENQIYLCKYHDVDKSILTTIGLNENEVDQMIKKLKENGLYEQYRNLPEEEYEDIIKKEKKKSKYEKILDKYKFDKTKKSYEILKQVLEETDKYFKTREEMNTSKIFRKVALKNNVQDYIIANDCKRILDNAYNSNLKIFNMYNYKSKPTIKEFIIKELNLQHKEEIIDSSEENKNIKKEEKEPENTKVEDIEYVKVPFAILKEYWYLKGYIDGKIGKVAREFKEGQK